MEETSTGTENCSRSWSPMSTPSQPRFGAKTLPPSRTVPEVVTPTVRMGRSSLVVIWFSSAIMDWMKSSSLTFFTVMSMSRHSSVRPLRSNRAT